jgi:two-component system sensor histidine kinase AlgZ
MTPAPVAAGGDFLPELCSSRAVFLLVLVAELFAFLLTLSADGLSRFSWELLALASFQVQWITLLSAMCLCRLREPLRRWKPATAGAVSFGLVLLVTLVISLAGQWVQYGFLGQPFRWDGLRLLSDLLIAAIIAGVGLRYLYLQQQLRNQQGAELQARIQALQARIRPHFLFNSMNSIASLIAVDPDTAERVVEDLAELFRASLAEPTLVPVSRELELARRYLAIEQLRLGERLQVEWQLEDLQGEGQVPSMLLQPLLENAVFHGIEPLPGGGTIKVTVSRSQGQLCICIINPLPSSEFLRGNGTRSNRMALANIRHRLAAHYGSAARLHSSAQDGIFTLLIVCPLE